MLAAEKFVSMKQQRENRKGVGAECRSWKGPLSSFGPTPSLKHEVMGPREVLLAPSFFPSSHAECWPWTIYQMQGREDGRHRQPCPPGALNTSCYSQDQTQVRVILILLLILICFFLLSHGLPLSLIGISTGSQTSSALCLCWWDLVTIRLRK